MTIMCVKNIITKIWLDIVFLLLNIVLLPLGVKKMKELSYKNLLVKFKNSDISIVCDSYDYFNAVKNIFAKNLKSKIIKRNKMLYIRPDIGIL